MLKKVIWYREFEVYHPRKKNLTMFKPIVVTPIKAVLKVNRKVEK